MEPRATVSEQIDLTTEGRASKGNRLAAVLWHEKGMGRAGRLGDAKIGGAAKAKARNAKRWTADEETLLVELVDRYGDDAWDEIAAHLPDRSRGGIEQHWQVMHGTHRSCTQRGRIAEPSFSRAPHRPLLDSPQASDGTIDAMYSERLGPESVVVSASAATTVYPTVLLSPEDVD